MCKRCRRMACASQRRNETGPQICILHKYEIVGFSYRNFLPTGSRSICLFGGSGLSKELAGKTEWNRDELCMSGDWFPIGKEPTDSGSENSAFFKSFDASKRSSDTCSLQLVLIRAEKQEQMMTPAVHQCASWFSKEDWELGNHPILVRPSMILELCDYLAGKPLTNDLFPAIRATSL